MHTGRVLESKEVRYIVAGGATYAPKPLARFQLENQSSPETYPAFAWGPQMFGGLRVGAGAGWEFNAAVVMPAILGGRLGVRKRLADTGQLAVALCLDGSASYGILGGGDQSASFTALTARAALDMSIEWETVALYASPGWMTLGYRAAATDEADQTASAFVGQQLIGSAIGVRLGWLTSVYIEVGYWRSLDGANTLLAPALGLEFDGTPPPPAQY